jgi:hypothetical protein
MQAMLRPTRRDLVVLLGLSIVPGAATAAAAPQLTVDGLAPVRLGMTIAQAQRALGARLGHWIDSFSGFAAEKEAGDDCWIWRRRDGKDPNIYYMTEQGAIRRIDVDGQAKPIPTTTTVRGIRIGSSEGEVRRAYPDLQLEQHPLAEVTRWAVVERKGTAGVRIEMRDGAVTSMFAARGRTLDYPEGCS